MTNELEDFHMSVGYLYIFFCEFVHPYIGLCVHLLTDL